MNEPNATGEDAGRRWYSVQKGDFKLCCDNLADVSKQHARVPFILYALYRLVFALYFVGFLIFFGVASADFLGAKFLIYLTDWTYMMATFYLCLACVNALLDLRKRHRHDDTEERLRYQIHWFLLNVCATVSVIVIIVYWAALRLLMEEKLPIYLDVSIHLLPGVVCLIDIFLTAVVIRFVHVVYTLAYLFVYLLFALIYWAAGGTDVLGNPFIYPIIDFGNYPGIAAASVVGVCLVTLLTQAALKGLYVLRVRCLERRSEVGSRTLTAHHQVLEVELDHGDTDS